MLKHLIEQWLGEEKDEIKAHNESTEEKWRVIGYNQALTDLKSRIPELEEIILGEIEKAPYIRDMNVARYRNDIINSLKGDKE